jgi:hypothetical protein
MAMPTIPTNMSEQKNDLDWSAFCYLAGEMSQAQMADFEARLSEDQAAREALARAVELTQVVAAAESQRAGVVPAARSQAAWYSRAAWAAIGSLALVLLVMVWSRMAGPPGSPVGKDGQSEHQLALAAAWTEARQDFDQGRENGAWPGSAGIGDANDEFTAMSDLSEDEVAFDGAPSWMTTAVFSLAGRPLDDGEAFVNERLEN